MMSQVFPVGAVLQNGFTNGGSRFYPYSTGLAMKPPAMYGQYIGSGGGLPVSPPVAALVGTTGIAGNTTTAAAVSHPLSLKYSPLPWVIAGVFGAVFLTHQMHYKKKG